MASFAYDVVDYVSHLLPPEQVIDRHFSEEPSVKGECNKEDNCLDFSVPLEAEHLEALELYEQIVADEAADPEELFARVYDFLKKAGEKDYPFGFWFECCQLTLNRDFSLAFILLEMSVQANSSEESLHVLYKASLEAVYGADEFDAVSCQMIKEAISNSIAELTNSVSCEHVSVVCSLLGCFIDQINSGEHTIQGLSAIESAFLKLIRNS